MRGWLLRFTATAVTAVIALACSGPTGGTGPGPTARPPAFFDAEGLDLASLKESTVLITSHPSDPISGGWGSGSVISRDGLILTNAHVAANRSPGLGVLFGLPIVDASMGPASPEIMYVYTVIGDAPATPAYQARVLAADGYLDFAVLQITARADGTRLNPADLDLSAVPLGSVEDIAAGEGLTVFGFPGVAGSFRIHVTRGTFSNLKDDELVGQGGWMNTDATIAQGNSGGLAADSRGRLVGIPDRVQPDPRDAATAEYVMRPVDLALPLIEAARNGRPWNQYTYVTAASGDETAAIRGWATTALETCEPTPAPVTGAPSVLVPQIEFGAMVPGDHVLVLLFAGLDDNPRLVDSIAFNWPDNGSADSCIPFSFANQQTFASGPYSVLVFVGPNYEINLAVENPTLALTGDGPGSTSSTTPPTVTSPSPGSVAACDSIPIEGWDGTGGQFAGLNVPPIPYPSGEQAGGLVFFWSELTDGPTDRRTAEQMALAERAASSTGADGDARWVVVEVEGEYHTFYASLWRPVIGGEVNPILPCALSPGRAKLVSMFATFEDVFGTGAYYHSEWALETGHTITDGNTGEIILSGEGGAEPPRDVPFQAGADADAWLLANINARNLGVACQNSRADVGAWGNGAIAQVICSSSDVYDNLMYTLYESPSALEAYWAQQMGRNGNSVASELCPSTSWIVEGNAADPKGGLLCERLTMENGQAVAQIEWTEDDWRIAAFVNKTHDPGADPVNGLVMLWNVWRQGTLPEAP